jgi:hypothetical protein
MSPFGIASIVVLVRHNRRLALSRDVSGSHVESETRRESEARRESETRREDPAS